MEHRRKAGRRAPPSGVAGSTAPALKAVAATVSPNAAALPNITAVVEAGGQIMVGTVAPIRNAAAVAHDGKKTLAMLRRRPHEPIPDLLARLDAAIGTANAPGTRVDEINTAGASHRYEI